MRRSPNPWPIGLREPNPAGVRETRAVAVMVGHSEEVGSGYASAGGERYLLISVASDRRLDRAHIDSSPVGAYLTMDIRTIRPRTTLANASIN